MRGGIRPAPTNSERRRTSSRRRSGARRRMALGSAIRPPARSGRGPRRAPRVAAGPAQDDLVAVLAGSCASTRRRARSARRRSTTARAASRAARARGPEIVPEAKRSPTPSDAPLTVRCASCWAADQYRWRALVRATAVPLSSTSRSRSKRPRLLAQVGERRGLLRRGADAAVEDGLQRRDPRGHRGRERLGQERPQRAVLPRLQVARAPVVDQQPRRRRGRARAPRPPARPSRSARRRRSPARARCRGARWGRRRARRRPARGAGRAAGGSACR